MKTVATSDQICYVCGNQRREARFRSLLACCTSTVSLTGLHTVLYLCLKTWVRLMRRLLITLSYSFNPMLLTVFLWVSSVS